MSAGTRDPHRSSEHPFRPKVEQPLIADDFDAFGAGGTVHAGQK
jgi:hypothetical protein